MSHFKLPTEETHRLVFMEDDAAYEDKETVREAWVRLYGETYPIKHVGNTHDRRFAGGVEGILDCGDATAWELRDGKIVVSSFDGASIWEPKP